MRHFLGIWCAVAAVLLTACKDDIYSAGASAMQEGEEVVVKTDTLRNIRSYVWEKELMLAHPIINTPDSFLLGECSMVALGTIKADILTQFACPVGFTYPDSVTLDSVCLYVYYSSWFGDGYSPLRLTAYEMDLQGLSYDSVYSSNLNPLDYCSMTPATYVVDNDRTIVPATKTDSIYSSARSAYIGTIVFRMNDRFAEKLFSMRSFPSQEWFNEQMKGLLITSNFGSSNCLYVSDMAIGLHYHYYYKNQPEDTEYQSMADAKFFYANQEVRQVNRYDFPQRDEYVYEMMQEDDSSNYIVSPAYVYTVVEIPMCQMKERIQDSIGDENKMRPYINYASLEIEVENAESDGSVWWNWAYPASTMLLIREDSVDNFFLNNGLPSDYYALTGTLVSTIDSTDVTHYAYEFDMVNLFERYLRQEDAPDNLRMVLIPVSLEYSTTSSSAVVSKVNIEQSITVTQIKSAQHHTSPMDIEMVYSGFSNVVIH